MTSFPGSSNRLKIASYLVVLLALFYLGLQFYKLDFSPHDLPRSLAFWTKIIGLSAGYGVAVFVVVGLSWKLTLQVFSSVPVRAKDIFCLCGKANIAKYLPGNVMHFVGRNILGKKLGLDHAEMASSTIVEAVLMAGVALVLVTLLMGLGFLSVPRVLIATLQNGGIIVWLCVSVVALVALRLLARYRRTLFVRVVSLTRRFATRRFIVLVVQMFLVYIPFFLFHGIMLIYVYNLLGTVTINDLATSVWMIGATTLAWLSGYIVPGAPGGLGVRESVLVLALGPMLGSKEILLTAIMTRLIIIVGDLTSFLISIGYEAVAVRRFGRGTNGYFETSVDDRNR